MLGFEIQERILSTIPFAQEHFLGIFAADEFVASSLKKANKKRSCAVINTEGKNHDGAHWWACFWSLDGHFEIFDSLGVTEELARKRLGRRARHCVYNTSRVQGSSKSCGKFVAYFCVTRLLNFSETYNEVFTESFTTKTDLNEMIVNRFWDSGKLFSNDQC
jgi:hypothetical protein